jgi:DNA-binding CsgD family transcriptional regulator
MDASPPNTSREPLFVDTPEGRYFLARDPNGARLARAARTLSQFHVAVDELALLNRELSQLIALLDRDLVLARAVRLLTEDFGFHCAWIGERANVDGVVIGHTSGNRTDRLYGLTLRTGCGLGGKVFAEGRLAWVNGYLGSPEITHDYDGETAAERIQCMIAAPIGDGPRPAGVLLGGLREDGGFGGRAAAIVETVAERTAQALVAAERARRSEEAALFEERQRLALDLHDSVGAMLSAISAGVRRVSGEMADATVRERLGTIERQAGEAAQTLRDALRTMRAPAVRREERRRRGPRTPIARREYEVLRRVATGQTNGEIALAMSLSPNTVKAYLRNAMQKLDARNRVEAISRAREAGLL